MEILYFRDFMKKKLENDTMNESELRRVHIYKNYPTDGIITTNKGFVTINNGRMGGTHWTCFIIKDNKSYYFDSLGGAPDKFLLNQSHKSIINHNYKIQEKYSKLCGSFCLYFFHFLKGWIFMIVF